MANLQVVLLTSVRNNNSVTGRSWSFVIGTLPGSPAVPDGFIQKVIFFFFAIFAMLDQQNSEKNPFWSCWISWHSGVYFNW